LPVPLARHTEGPLEAAGQAASRRTRFGRAPRRPLRITHVITGLETGGAERMLEKVVARLDGDGFDMDVVCLTAGGPMAEPIAARGVRVRTLGMRPGRLDPRRVAWLARRLRAERPAVVQTWTYQADLVGGLAARLGPRAPVVWGLRGGIDRRESKLNTRVSARLCAALSSQVPERVVSCSTVLADAHVAMGYDPRPMTVIPNGFDTEAFRPDEVARRRLRHELGIADDAPLVGLVARLAPQKDHATFLAAAQRVARWHPDARFVLAGAGISADEPLLADAMSQPLAGRCHLLGLRTDVATITAALDVAVSASAFGEGFSNALGEALCCGVPCVATDVGESALIVGDAGRVVAPRRPDDLAGEIGALIAMSREGRAALGARGRARFEARFDIGSIAGRYATLYEELAADGR
jgi:glycosyltransferase involved in cell wall biosynthesis